MYTVDSTVSFTITRPQLKTGEVAADAISVRSVDPDGIFGSIALTTDSSPTLLAPGEVSFSDVLNKKGVWRYEILTSTNVAHVTNVHAVNVDTTYTSTVKF
tara:strand:+ start:100 stop:402 length:303 start_codon:yes stop_codon:yes gene_type:complete